MTFSMLSEKQRQVFRWCYQPGSYALICDGSVRSGKTASMICSFVLWAMSSFQNARFGICGNTVQSAERNIIMELEQMADITHYFQLHYLGSKHILTVTGNGTVNRFHVFGGKDEASYKLVQGLTLSGVLFDEVALMPESFVNQAIARTLSVSGAKLWFNCNPDSPEHWFYKQWVEKCDHGQRTDTRHIHFLMQDNPTMSPEKIRKAESMFSGVFHRRYVLGEWCLAEGVIYPQFDSSIHVRPNAVLSGCWYISVDYGTLNAFSAGLWRYDGKKAYRAAEWYHSGRDTHRQLTDAQYVERIKMLAGGREIEAVIVDPSAASFIAALRQAGFYVRKGKNDVINGISLTSTLLYQGRLFFDPSCRDIIREFGLYRWDEKSPTDRPVKEHDHAMDDMRYFVYTIMRYDM